MEARIARLEAHVEHIREDVSEIRADIRSLSKKVDFHLILVTSMIIAAALGLAGLMAKGFGWF